MRRHSLLHHTSGLMQLKMRVMSRGNAPCGMKALVSFADMYLFGDPLNRQIFRGSFVVSSWGNGGGEVGGGRGNHSREGDLRQALLDVYKNSQLRSCFVSAEILALDTWVEVLLAYKLVHRYRWYLCIKVFMFKLYKSSYTRVYLTTT